MQLGESTPVTPNDIKQKISTFQNQDKLNSLQQTFMKQFDKCANQQKCDLPQQKQKKQEQLQKLISTSYFNMQSTSQSVDQQNFNQNTLICLQNRMLKKLSNKLIEPTKQQQKVFRVKTQEQESSNSNNGILIQQLPILNESAKYKNKQLSQKSQVSQMQQLSQTNIKQQQNNSSITQRIEKNNIEDILIQEKQESDLINKQGNQIFKEIINPNSLSNIKISKRNVCKSFSNKSFQGVQHQYIKGQQSNVQQSVNNNNNIQTKTQYKFGQYNPANTKKNNSYFYNLQSMRKSSEQQLFETAYKSQNQNTETTQTNIEGTEQEIIFTSPQNQVSVSSNNRYQNKQNSINLITSFESPIIKSNNLDIINHLKISTHQKDNFYAQFLNQCLQQNKQQQQSLNQSTQLSCITTTSGNSTNFFEKNIEKIKLNLSQMMIKLLQAQLFKCNGNTTIEDSGNLYDEQIDYYAYYFPEKAKLLDKSNCQQTQKRVNQQSQEIIQRNINGNQSQQGKKHQKVEKLIQFLANQDKIVVHTSQNKHLMQISDRSEVVDLTQWLEEMVNNVYQQNSNNFNTLCEELQVIYAACISEIIRQVSIQCQERGQLLKNTWEGLLELVTQGFNEALNTKQDNIMQLKQQIDKIHNIYLTKVETYIPQIEELKSEIEKKEQINKKVLEEYRYLRKKDAKLEKYLKQCKKEIKNLQDDHIKLIQEFDRLKQNYEDPIAKATYEKLMIDNMKQQEINLKNLDLYFGKGQGKLNSIDDVIQDNSSVLALIAEKEQLEKVTKIQQQQGNRKISNVVKQYQQKIHIQQQDEYSGQLAKGDIQKFNEISQKEIIEIEGPDGFTLQWVQMGVQVGRDLIQTKDKNLDTNELNQKKNFSTQTMINETCNKEVQTVSIFAHQIANAPKISSTINLPAQQKRMSLIDNLSRDTKSGRKDSFLFSLAMAEQLQQCQQQILQKQHSNSITNILGDTMLKSVKTCHSIDEDVEQEEKDDDEVSPKSNNDEKSGHLLSNILKIPFQKDQSSLNQDVIKATTPDTLEKYVKNQLEDDVKELQSLALFQISLANQLIEQILQSELLKENNQISQDNLFSFLNSQEAFQQQYEEKIKRILDLSKNQQLEIVKHKIQIAEKNTEYSQLQQTQTFISIINQKLTEQNKKLKANQNQNEERKGSIKDVEEKDQQMNQARLSKGQLTPSSSDTSSSNSDSESKKKKKEKEQNNQKQKVKRSSTISSVSESSLGSQQGTNEFEDKIAMAEKIQNQNQNNEQAQEEASLNNRRLKRLNSIATPTRRKNIIIPQQNSNSKATIAQQQQKVNNQKKRHTKLLESLIYQENNKVLQQGTQALIQQQPQSILYEQKQRYKKAQNQSKKKSILGGQQLAQSVNNIMLQNKLLNLNSKHKKFVSYESPNTQDANKLQEKIRKKIEKKAINDLQTTMKQTNVLKLIQQIYTEKIKQYKLQQDSQSGTALSSLHVVIYDYFLNQLGFKKLAEQKIMQFIVTCMGYNYNFRIRMFTKFFGVDPIMNYDVDDFNFYINMLINCEDGAATHIIQNNQLPLQRVLEVYQKEFEGKIPSNKYQSIKSEIESDRLPDQMIKFKYVLESDVALDHLLRARVEEKKTSVSNLKNVYLAGDIDGNQVIGLNEFMLIHKNMEAEQYSYLNSITLFFQNCDLIDELSGEKNMSFSKFAISSVECNLFGRECQERYATMIESWDQIKRIDHLEKMWHKKKDVIRLRFVKTNTYSNQFRQMVIKIDNYLKLPVKDRKECEMYIWLVYRILDDESKRVMIEYQLQEILPIELFQIEEAFQNFLYKVLTIQ